MKIIEDFAPRCGTCEPANPEWETLQRTIIEKSKKFV